MRLLLAITTALVLAALAVGITGCDALDPWQRADKKVAVLASDVALRAEHEDVNYFKGLTPSRERVPELIELIAASGIATNYAEHLNVESDTDATLVYDQDENVTAFTIQLSLQDGDPRVDQIIVGERTKAVTGQRRAAPKPDMSTETTANASVALAISSGRPNAGTWQSALIRYTNTSNRVEWVSQPLESGVIIIYATGEPVSKWASEPAAQAGAVRLAPLDSTYRAVQFRAPGPGNYLLYGYANGVPSPTIPLHAVARGSE